MMTISASDFKRELHRFTVDTFISGYWLKLLKIISSIRGSKHLNTSARR